MEIDLHTKQRLANLLANPTLATAAHVPMLMELVGAYPYYQPLHLLLAKAKINDDDNHQAKAALYSGGLLLHRVLFRPETLVQPSTALLTDSQEPQRSEIKADALRDEQETFDEIVEIKVEPKHADGDEDRVYEEIVEFTAPVDSQRSANEETFEEIGEMPGLTLSSEEKLSDSDETYDEIAEVELPFTEIPETKDVIPDELAIESIVSNDFFAFEKNFTKEQLDEDTPGQAQPIVQPEEYNQEAEDQTVSKYNDDKLPYTFLWWLAKTRKEHEQIFQPYVTPKKSEENPSQLQQQYVEHIFHLQTPFNVAEEAKSAAAKNIVPHKGDEIIDKFIKNEPQIRAPKAEQINNENKAKKSAEDHNDLVSETLAAIYIEQMLYHKAIDTYQKLSLKFPEKSRYFADLIQSLEKKI